MRRLLHNNTARRQTLDCIGANLLKIWDHYVHHSVGRDCTSFASLMLNLHYVDLNLLKVTDINQSTAGPQQVRNMSTTNRRRLVEFERQRTNSGAEIIRLVSISS